MTNEQASFFSFFLKRTLLFDHYPLNSSKSSKKSTELGGRSVNRVSGKQAADDQDCAQ
jgi:hypothetical protein